MRTTYQDNDDFKMVIRLTDSNGELFDPTGGIFVSIFEPNIDSTDDSLALIHNASTVSYGDPGQEGIALITRESIGIYSYSVPIPADMLTGSWIDKWRFSHDGVETISTFTFLVIERPRIETTCIGENSLVRITLLNTIASITGESLGAVEVIEYYTPMTPVYASVNMVYMEAGGYLKNVPEHTIALALYEASIEADTLTFISPNGDVKWYNWARQKYVICSAARGLMTNLSSTMVKRKKLGDFEVEWDPDFSGKLDELTDCMLEMRRAIQSGGELGPGTSLKPTITIPGMMDPDRPEFGRGFFTDPGYRGGANVKDFETDRSSRVGKTYRKRGSLWGGNSSKRK